MNKWIALAIPIIIVLAIGVIVTGTLYSQESDKLKEAQAEIVTLEGNVSALEVDLANAEARVLTLGAELLVSLPDARLEVAIREAIGKLEGPLYKSDLEAVTTIGASAAAPTEIGVFLSELTGLEYCINLLELYLGNNNVSDISPLAGLANLETLVLNNEGELTLVGNNVSDFSPLAGLTGLKVLELANNHIRDVSSLAGLTNLQELDLRENNISDISPLVENSGLSAGDTVNLSNNPLSATSVNVYIPQLEERGVTVVY